MSTFLEIFDSQGADKFTQFVCDIAPYFDSIDPEFVSLKPGYAELMLKKQKKVQNHLGTVHAIAMCNGAELVAGTMTDVSVPKGAKWIPVGMTVAYLAKAKTDLRIVTEADKVDFSQQGNLIVPVAAYDENDVKVFSADITMNVKHA